MPFYELILGGLAVWRLTHLLHAENGPWNILARLRARLQESFWGQLVDCFYCLSLWVGIPFGFWLGQGWGHRALLWLSFSAAAILLEGVMGRLAPPVLYYEEREVTRNAV